jgi:hypothetical protein
MLSNTPVEPVIEPAKQDKRFRNELWVQNPFFDHAKQWYLLWSRFFLSSVHAIEGIDPHTQHKTGFYTRQFVSALSPSNFVMTNPTVLNATLEARGENLLKGFRNLIEDLESGGGRLSLKMSDLGAFRFGFLNLLISLGHFLQVVYLGIPNFSLGIFPGDPGHRHVRAGKRLACRHGSDGSLMSILENGMSP